MPKFDPNADYAAQAKLLGLDEIPEIVCFSHRFHKDYFSTLLRSIAETVTGTYRILMSVAPGRCLESQNRALRQSVGRYIFICDEDIEFLDSGWMDILIRDLDENPRLAIVGAGQLKTEGERFDYTNGIWNPARVGLVVKPWQPCHLWAIDRAKIPDVCNDDSLPGVKGMHDAELCFQVRDLGFEIASDDRVVVYHPHKQMSDESRQDLQNPTLSEELDVYPRQILFMVKKWPQYYQEVAPKEFRPDVTAAIRKVFAQDGTPCPW